MGIVFIKTVRLPLLSMTRIAITVPRSLTKASGKFKVRLARKSTEISCPKHIPRLPELNPARLIKVGP